MHSPCPQETRDGNTPICRTRPGSEKPPRHLPDTRSSPGAGPARTQASCPSTEASYPARVQRPPRAPPSSPSTEERALSTRSLHQHVVNALGRSIIEGRYPPGASFTTSEIESEHEVSRSVAREAVRVLEHLRLVRSSPRVGSTVLPRDEWNMLAPDVVRWSLGGRDRLSQLRALTEIRTGIEPAAARFAARRASSDQYRTLRDAAGRMAELGREGQGNSPAYLEADKLFHSTLLHATGNPYFVNLDGTLTACLEGRSLAGLTPERPAEENLANHQDLAEAVGRRDEDAAARLAEHLVAVVDSEIG
jgi:DNA-binding FadR family transcriptional regulator